MVWAKCQHTWNAVLVTVFGFVVVGQPLRDLSIAGIMAHIIQQLKEGHRTRAFIYVPGTK